MRDFFFSNFIIDASYRNHVDEIKTDTTCLYDCCTFINTFFKSVTIY